MKPSEVIIVKDGPVNDKINEYINYLKNDSRIKIIESTKNIGLGNALALGLSHCSNEFVARMDSDDICEPERFEIQIPYMIKHKLDVCGTWVTEFEMINGRKEFLDIKKMPSSHLKCIRLLKLSSPFNHPSVILRKSKVLEAGNYKHNYLKEDIDLWLRMFEIGSNFGNVQKSLLQYRYTNVLKRRRGMKYLLSELSIIKLKRKIRLVNSFEYFTFSLLAIIIRIQPTFILKYCYKLFRRINN